MRFTESRSSIQMAIKTIEIEEAGTEGRAASADVPSANLL